MEKEQKIPIYLGPPDSHPYRELHGLATSGFFSPDLEVMPGPDQAKVIITEDRFASDLRKDYPGADVIPFSAIAKEETAIEFLANLVKRRWRKDPWLP